jgi:hypothetical protein
MSKSIINYDDLADYLVFLLGEEPLKVSQTAVKLINDFDKEKKDLDISEETSLINKQLNIVKWDEGFVLPAIYEEVLEGTYLGNDWLPQSMEEKKVQKWVLKKVKGYNI